MKLQHRLNTVDVVLARFMRVELKQLRAAV
jgi:hypothetical protein